MNQHWKPRFTMKPTLSSLTTSWVVVDAIAGAPQQRPPPPSDLTINLYFQCIYPENCCDLSFYRYSNNKSALARRNCWSSIELKDIPFDMSTFKNKRRVIALSFHISIITILKFVRVTIYLLLNDRYELHLCVNAHLPGYTLEATLI